MKNLLLILFGILPLLFISNNYTQAMSVSDFTPTLDKKVASMKTAREKVEYLKSFSNSLNDAKYTKSKDARLYKDIQKYVENMLRVFEYELSEEQGNGFTQTSSKINSLPHMSDNFSNIDVQKVREAILSWHNEERKNVGANSYIYNLDLEGSATTWANNLANSGKTKNLHARKAGDGFYNYNSMTNRFGSLGINFGKAPKGAAAFSETVGRNVYKCDKSDCTQDLINAVKKTWTGLIMKEEASKGSHYKAATMKYFTQMGAGIAIDKNNNRYYIVIHYGVNF